MTPTKQILNLIEKRRKYGTLANAYDGKVMEWMQKHNVDIGEMICDYGCMLTTEPDVYARNTIEIIQRG